MIAFLVAGLVLGVLARVRGGGFGASQLLVSILSGVTGSLVGGMSSNRMVGRDVGELTAVSLLAAVAVGMAGIALVEAGARRERSE